MGVKEEQIINDLNEIIGKEHIIIKHCENGKGLFARSKICQGEVFMKDSVVFSAPILDNPDPCTYCAHCSSSILSPQYYFKGTWKNLRDVDKDLIVKCWPKVESFKCKLCNEEFYCSEKCLDDAWNRYHQVLCPSLDSFSKKLYDLCRTPLPKMDTKVWNAPFSPILIARILAQFFPNYSSSSLLEEEVMDSLKSFVGFPDHGNSSIFQVYDIIKCIFPISQDFFLETYYRVAFNAQSFNSPLYNTKVVSDFLLNLDQCSKDDTNHLYPILYELPIICDQTFSGLFKVHACLNHSCLPNAQVEDFKTDVILVRAISEIMEDDEITIPYIDIDMSKWARNVWLERAYHFKCHCMRCRFEGDSPFTCITCQKSFKEALLSCSRCHRAWYCSKNCQKMHWKAGHKLICIKRNPLPNLKQSTNNSDINLSLLK